MLKIFFEKLKYIALIVDAALAFGAFMFFIPQIKNAVKEFKPLAGKNKSKEQFDGNIERELEAGETDK